MPPPRDYKVRRRIAPGQLKKREREKYEKIWRKVRHNDKGEPEILELDNEEFFVEGFRRDGSIVHLINSDLGAAFDDLDTIQNRLPTPEEVLEKRRKERPELPRPGGP